MGREKELLFIGAVMNARSIVSIAGITDKTGGVDVEKNSVPSFKI